MRRSTSGSIELAVKIVLLDEAQRRFEAEDEWWRENRDAKELFVAEFEWVLEQLNSMPGIGQRYRFARGKLIQRVLMKKTGCHVYYFYDREHDLVEIHSIWGARRERGPKL
jgi:plasmid stabilization system protein ParE